MYVCTTYVGIKLRTYYVYKMYIAMYDYIYILKYVYMHVCVYECRYAYGQGRSYGGEWCSRRGQQRQRGGKMNGQIAWNTYWT
jgi:hypothetical protein